jgi:hypothetical protein
MKRTPKQPSHFVVCLNNKGCKASLKVGKLYRFIPDKEASAHELIRVVDESGEDYAFSTDRFYSIDVPPTVESALMAASQN